VSVLFEMDAALPLNCTEVAPDRCAPEIVTVAPTAPEPGAKPVMLGALGGGVGGGGTGGVNGVITFPPLHAPRTKPQTIAVRTEPSHLIVTSISSECRTGFQG
jgi:hypothetical protein